MVRRKVEADTPPVEVEGIYPALIMKLEDKTITVQGENRDVIEWTYLVGMTDEENGWTAQVTGLTGNKITPRTNLGKFITNVMGQYPDATDFDDEVLIGMPCQVYVTLDERKTARGTFVNAKAIDVQPPVSERKADYGFLRNVLDTMDIPF